MRLTTVTTVARSPRRARPASSSCWMRSPISPSEAAPRTNSGWGGTSPSLSSFCRSSAPTWGPLPWVTTNW
jgi:hypothetical protein